jgi:hypothetical protein
MEEDAYQSSPGDYLVYLFHIATYDWAKPHVANARVLDFGTAAGYAARMGRHFGDRRRRLEGGRRLRRRRYAAENRAVKDAAERSAR